MSSRICSTVSGNATDEPSSRNSSSALSASCRICDFLPAEPGRFDFVVVIALGLRHVVQPHRAFVHCDLPFQHFAETGGELGQRPFHFLFAELSQDALQLGLGLLQLAKRFALLVGSALSLGIIQFLAGFFHLLLSIAEPLGGAVGWLLRLGRRLFAATVLAL